MKPDFAFEPLLGGLYVVQCTLLAVPHGVQLGLASFELHPGPLELGLAGSDLVAGGLDSLDGVACLIA
jgi:hypothetical protein